MENEPSRDIIIAFLREIGLRVEYGTVEQDAFLPGIAVRHGGLVVDARALRHPCDLLHEAGHLAVVPSSQRERLDGNVEVDNAHQVEVAAIAWSFAAATHLGLTAAALFHSEGYRGKGDALALGFSLGVYPGAALLETMGLTRTRAGDGGSDGYPKMLRWLAA